MACQSIHAGNVPQPLSAIHQAFAHLKRGEVPARVVIDLAAR